MIRQFHFVKHLHCSQLFFLITLLILTVDQTHSKSLSTPPTPLTLVEVENSHDTIQQGLPSGWRASRKDISMYSICAENGYPFLRINTQGGCTSIGKQYSFSVTQFPYLEWKWRIHELPANGCENVIHLNDSGAGFYVIFRGRFKLNRILKYVWSTTLPVGTITASPYNPNAMIVVLESGTHKLDTWVSELVNLHKDYERIFGGTPPPVEGFGVLSDADNTKSTACADYADIKIKAEE